MAFIPAQSFQHQSHFVYGCLCQDTGGLGYIKFGLSSSIGARISALKTACPLPIQFICVLEVRSREKAREVEKALHKTFSARKVSGEWFSFDFSSAEDKRAFNDGCRTVFLMEIGPAVYWTKISAARLAEYDQERRSHFLSSKHRKKIERLRYYDAERNRAWRELSEYM